MDRTKVDLMGLQATVDRAARFAAALIGARGEKADSVLFQGRLFEYRCAGPEGVRISEGDAVLLEAHRSLGSGVWTIDKYPENIRNFRLHLVEWTQRFNTENFKATHVHPKKAEESGQTAPA